MRWILVGSIVRKGQTAHALEGGPCAPLGDGSGNPLPHRGRRREDPFELRGRGHVRFREDGGGPALFPGSERSVWG